jgi:hypothetical protein
VGGRRSGYYHCDGDASRGTLTAEPALLIARGLFFVIRGEAGNLFASLSLGDLI